jgi:hypothetical protein
MAVISCVHFPTLVADATNTQSFKSWIILDGPEETGDFPRGMSTVLMCLCGVLLMQF